MKLTDGFTRDINLPGWAEQSIRGYDPYSSATGPPYGATTTARTNQESSSASIT